MVRLFLVTLLLASGSVWGEYPSRAIRIYVPNPPGGATDTLARVFAPGLAEALGQPVIVENRPGSNGNLAMEATAHAAPDGHTLLLCADAQIVIGPHLYAHMPLDTLKDLDPVATLVNTQMVLSVSPALPVKNLQEFIEYARHANPPLAYASIGNGSQHHLVMEMLKARAGIDLMHVPFKGGGPATIAILAGEVSAMFGGNSVSGHIRSGKLRALAVAGRKRSAAYPDLPRLSEFYPGLEVTPWLALFTPAGTPGVILARLRGETNKLLGEAELSVRIRNVGGLEPYVTTPDEFAALLRSEYAKYGEIVKAVGAKVD
ncbi:MAG TPA: tripartite tricarboxylate transporter substrate binding protein [Burkholderiales bacterium]|nr:tripartite tricarboxylate transporter substrate binding protein [Burkholderiales bacterium]